MTDDHAIAMDEISAWNRDSQRQYTGTAGRIENSQIAVFLAYASPPAARSWTGPSTCRKPWTEDADRMPSGRLPRGDRVRDQARPGPAR